MKPKIVGMVAKDSVRKHLSQLDVWKSMGADKMHLRVLREETHVILRRLSSLKGHDDLGRLLMTGRRQLSHSSSKRRKKEIQGMTDQPAAPHSLVRLWGKLVWKPFYGM